MSTYRPGAELVRFNARIFRGHTWTVYAWDHEDARERALREYTGGFGAPSQRARSLLRVWRHDEPEPTN
jgi:hypothetical protein